MNQNSKIHRSTSSTEEETSDLFVLDKLRDWPCTGRWIQGNIGTLHDSAVEEVPCRAPTSPVRHWSVNRTRWEPQDNLSMSGTCSKHVKEHIVWHIWRSGLDNFRTHGFHIVSWHFWSSSIRLCESCADAHFDILSGTKSLNASKCKYQATRAQGIGISCRKPLQSTVQ